MPLPENFCSTLFTTGYKRLTEGGHKAFCFGGFCFEAFALGILLWGFLLEAFAFGFWAFGFLMWEAMEGKRIVEGKMN
jgi:hypothetical protein